MGVPVAGTGSKLPLPIAWQIIAANLDSGNQQ
jgi:hypothetical protein